MITSDKLKGTGVAMITPFEMDGAIDFPGLEVLVDQLIQQGVDYLVVLGTTAETPTLSKKEKLAVIDRVIEKNAARVPVIVGAGSNSTKDVIDWMREVQRPGIDAWLSVVPYYNKPSQEGMKQHFNAIAAASELPLVFYNVPGRTSSNMQASTCVELAHELGDKAIAVKEASGDMGQIMNIIREKPEDFLVLSGDDALTLSMIGVGARGVISVIGNALPGEFTRMVKAALEGDFESARRMHYSMLPIMQAIFKEGNPTGVKALMEIMGKVKNSLRLPLIASTEAHYRELEQLLKKL